ncbi:LOW QUALITY PROTEIN: transcription initiation factor TFIID subunit 12-like [Myotis myotis]|uniref:LOW QUALITY PROTEIN: transcription initiation factor TFIID subunit 12-like n=1 Tax=Myotis myotis TaxID=51298 RepID=UPI001749E485|nr:LOW QUALITY PROTEIN: transcription initiation factor TFIID subunit 12-like [Myotis myotis]
MVDPTAEYLVQLSGKKTPYGGQMTLGGNQTPYGDQMTFGGNQTPYGGQMTFGGEQTPYGGQMTFSGNQTRYGGQMTCGGGQMTALKGGYPLTFTGNQTFTRGQVTTHSSDKTLDGGQMGTLKGDQMRAFTEDHTLSGTLMIPLPLIGLGPHTSRKKQDLDKLYELQSKALQNQFGPSALINLSNLSAIKPEPASTPPQGSMANSTTVVKIPGRPGSGGRLSPEDNQVLTKKKLQDLVREVDPNEELDEDVEEMLLPIADGFIESAVPAACQLARHRESSTLEVKGIQLYLQRRWNTCISGFGSEEIRPYKKACTTEAHKQRMALIRETTKK